MKLIGEIEYGLPTGDELGSLAVVHCCRREQLQGGMMVLVVVPGEELLAKNTRILDGAEAVRIIWSILQGLEVGFRERVVIGDMRPAVSLDNTEVGKQERQRL